MVKRQFNDEERAITEKNLTKRKKMLEVLNKAIEISNYRIDTIMPFEYEQAIEQEKLTNKKLINKFEETELIIKVTEDQLINGIEDLDTVPEVEETDGSEQMEGNDNGHN